MQLTKKKNPKVELRTKAALDPVAKAKKKREKSAGARKKAAKEKRGRGRFILTIGDEGGILVFMRGSTVVRRLFAPSPQPVHVEAMSELMKANPGTKVQLLVDVLDQQYVRQNFPPVSSLSVGGLIRRRLERDFQPEDITGALSLGREKEGRKEWNYLLISLAKTPLLQGWIDMLLELPNEFRGIYLLPVEATHYIQMLHKALTKEKPQSWQLLVSHHKVSGFRQVVMRDGKLVFTRVTQAIDDAIPAVISGNIEQEVINTVEYLRRLGFHDSGTLDAYVISSPDVRDALDMKRFNFGSSTVLTPLDVAELLDLEQAALSADRFGDVVMASAICRMNKRLLKLSTAYADKLAKFYLINRGMQAVAALAALALIGLGAQNIMGVLQDKKHIAETELKRQGLQEALNRGKSTVSQLNKDVAFKTAVVAVHDAYFKTRVTPLDFLGKLTGALSPEHRVTEFEWTKPALYKPAGSPAVVPTPRGAAAKKDVPPLEVRVTMTFAGSYAGAQDVNRAAETLLAGFKEAMPEYEIDHEPYPWADLLSKTQEVSFDQDANSQSLPTSGVTYIFRGPKKADKAKGGRV